MALTHQEDSIHKEDSIPQRGLQHPERSRMLFSHHSHSGQFCDHAENTLEEMVQAAIKHEFRVFALTEHAPRDRVEDLYPGEVCFG